MSKYRPIVLAYVALLIVGALLVLGAAQAHSLSTGSPTVTADHAPRVCFPARDWGPVPDEYRPCVRITRVAEDGSFHFQVSDADGVVRYGASVGALDR